MLFILMRKIKLIYLLSIIVIVFLSCENTARKHGNSNTQQHKVVENNIVQGKAIKVLDGDTYDLLLANNTTIRIRMQGIDAPEKGMPFGNKAKKYLSELCWGQTIRVQETGKEGFGRIIALSYLPDGRELGEEMLRAGLAWHFKKYSSDKKLAELEDATKTAKIGLWVEQPYILPPWIVRKLNKQGYKIVDIYRAQREHLKGLHVTSCPDEHLCEAIKTDNWYEQK